MVHSNALKPYLTENNKTHKLKFCISMLSPISIANNNPVFEDMYCNDYELNLMCIWKVMFTPYHSRKAY